MERRRKFCDVSISLPSDAFDVLMVAANAHGQAWHVAYAEIERRLRQQVPGLAAQIVADYAAEIAYSHRDEAQNGPPAAAPQTV